MKIHGDISQIDKCVIFTSQYRELYDESKLATFQLKKLFSSNSVLFIGFSFTDPFVTNLFHYVSSLYEEFGKKHFIVSDVDVDLKNIETINIQNYSNLNPFIEQLCNIKDARIETLIDDENVINVREIDSGDIPPDVNDWVGREKELSAIDSDSFKVIAITGLGGEGKSALASHYLNEVNRDDSNLVLEWRDFKEEDHIFQQKISSMIYSVTNDITSKNLAGLSDDELVTLFFKKLGNKKTIFVLDNVDSYIDLEKFKPVGGIGKLFNKAMEVEHNSKFVFTCRPFIAYAGVEFFQLSLTGFDENNTIEYFRNGKTQIPNIKIKEYACRAFTLTSGHALWLSLLLAQARRGEAILNQLLDDIESGISIERNDSSLLSEKVLSSIWGTLQDRDKLVLRTLAESVRAETIDDYAEILSPELNYNKFTKAFNALRNLNLLIKKRDSNFIELHPLVKEFVRKNHQTSDRSKYISLLIRHYDKYIVILKKVLSYKLSFEEFLNFTNKAELSINAGDFQSATSTLSEIHSSMSAAGYTEEFLRVSKLLFNAITWSKKKTSKLNNFESLLEDTIRSAVEFGSDDFANSLISKFENLIENKEKAYIRLCGIKSYVYWFRSNYDDSISIAEEALYLLKKGSQPDSHSIEHHKALSYRDCNSEVYLSKALDYFCKNKELSVLIDTTVIDAVGSGELYGNVGKCLALQGKYEDSLACYYQSFYFIFRDDNSCKLINIGYASLWISESLSKTTNKNASLYFYKYAMESWKSSSPALVNRNIGKVEISSGDVIKTSIMSQEFWRIEKFCVEWISKHLGVEL